MFFLERGPGTGGHHIAMTGSHHIVAVGRGIERPAGHLDESAHRGPHCRTRLPGITWTSTVRSCEQERQDVLIRAHFHVDSNTGAREHEGTCLFCFRDTKGGRRAGGDCRCGHWTVAAEARLATFREEESRR
jgi:hypothetical protein